MKHHRTVGGKAARAAMLALTCLSLHTSQLQAAELVSAEGVIENLSFNLIDLDTTDGITPWVNFTGSFAANPVPSDLLRLTVVQTAYGGTPSSQQRSFGSLPFSTEAGTVSDTRSTASKVDAGFSSQATLTSDDLADPRLQDVLTSLKPESGAMLLRNQASAGTHYALMLELSPMTALVFNGAVKGRVTADPSLLEGASLQAAAQGHRLELDAVTQVYTGFNTYPQDPLGVREPFGNWTYTASLPDKFRDVPTSFEQDISWTLANDDTQSVSGSMSIDLLTDVSLVILPAIPEPGTVPLMLFGATGLAMAVWRRRPPADRAPPNPGGITG